jgi:predicted transcriptional regulator
MNISFSIPEDLIARLDALAKSMDRSRSYVANEAMLHYVSYHEWFIASVETAVAKADSGGPFVSHDEVLAGAGKRRTKRPT